MEAYCPGFKLLYEVPDIQLMVGAIERLPVSLLSPEFYFSSHTEVCVEVLGRHRNCRILTIFDIELVASHL